MSILRQTSSSQLLAPDAFLWCTGIEDTFITAPWPRTGRILDEYELTGHYDRWHSDLALIQELGVPAARYGIPWHRINPARGTWHWEWTDRALDRLLELGIQPIVDLVHYGLPAWIQNAYLNPDFADYMAEYGHRVAERYRDRVFAYTPLNEPRITAWYCGRIGWWPPFQRSWRGFVQVMAGLCRGIVRTVEALRAVDPALLIAHVDATDLYRPADASAEEEAQRRQEIVFLALDLVSGRVTAEHRLSRWLNQHGVRDADLAWFKDHAVDLPLLGINLYPMFTQKVVARTVAGRLRISMPYAGPDLVEGVAKLYWERYRVPLFISETASVGSVSRRAKWLQESVAAVRRLREQGVGVCGYTWWPLFALVTWAYRQGEKPAAAYLKQMGLWDLNAELERVSTPLVELYRSYVQAGAGAVGRLNPAVRSFAASVRTAQDGS